MAALHKVSSSFVIGKITKLTGKSEEWKVTNVIHKAEPVKCFCIPGILMADYRICRLVLVCPSPHDFLECEVGYTV